MGNKVLLKRVLVTGGYGFVGSNLVPVLLERGYSVRILDNLSRGQKKYLSEYEDEIEFVQADITDFDSIHGAFYGVDTVVHLAAFGSVVESVSDPRQNFNMNVLGTFNVLQASADNNVSKLVFSSTGGALIGNAEPPVNECSLPKPISPYGASKLCGEAYCHAFAESFNMSVVALRFANVYGPNSEHKTGVFNKFAQQVMQEKPLTIFGDGSSTRDYIHVSDLCGGIALAVDSSALRNEVLHLATGKDTSLRELANLFLAQKDLDESHLLFKDVRTGEVEKNFADYSKARELLGFEPQINIVDGVRDAYRYLAGRYAGP